MKKRSVLRALVCSLLFAIGFAHGQEFSENAHPDLRGKIVAGYQGWFGAEGDGAGMGWKHYGGKNLAPGHCSFDIWPDLSEMDADEKFPTKFRFADGTAAHLFSSHNEKTVRRHFYWMREYGIDGAMLQRFGTTLRSPRNRDFNDKVMANVRKAAAAEGRGWAVMYDLSGLRGEELMSVVAEDWKQLSKKLKVREDPNYWYFNGKPLVAIWGVGFSDGRNYDLDACFKLIEFIQSNPEFGGNAIMLGVPYRWRELHGDAVNSEKLHELIDKVDVVSPWSVGRYGSSEQVRKQVPAHLEKDLARARDFQTAYLPVIFPGFSWQNLQKTRGKEAPLNAIDRDGGNFLWQQGLAAKNAGAEMIYVAMFDEIDEATAIMKTTNKPPLGESKFISDDDLPSDHYLWLTGEIGKMLKGEIPILQYPSVRDQR